jgi:hypothetical protein
MAGVAHDLSGLVHRELGACFIMGVYIASLLTLRMILTELWSDLTDGDLAASAVSLFGGRPVLWIQSSGNQGLRRTTTVSWLSDGFHQGPQGNHAANACVARR